jgi:hypothetical protein
MNISFDRHSVNNYPFEHLYCQNFLPEEHAELLWQAIQNPPREGINLNNGYTEFDALEHEEIYQDHFLNDRNTPQLREIKNFFLSEQTREQLSKKFNMKTMSTNTSIVLHREFKGFGGLDPHNDLEGDDTNKSLNMFLYLSKPHQCGRQHGTKLLSSQSYCTPYLNIPYQFNTLLAFPINESNWHSVEAINCDCTQRDVLVIRFDTPEL